MILVNFATQGYYQEVQKRENARLAQYVDKIISWSDKDIRKLPLYRKQKSLIEHADTGWGFCFWKPYILLEAICSQPEKEVICYIDVMDEVYNPFFFPWAESRAREMGGHFFVENVHIHKEWTKRDCFVVMNCDNERYWDHPQLEAGEIVLEVNRDNRDFLVEWLSWCENPLAIDKHPNILGKSDLPGFVDHRTDQSILTNLIIRKGWQTEPIWNVMKYIHYNKFNREGT